MTKKNGKDQGPYEHLLRGVPNTEENRKFWQQVAKDATKSKSRYGIRLRGRTPDPKKLDEGEPKSRYWRSTPLSKASVFSVYVIEKDRYRRNRWDNEYEQRRRTGLAESVVYDLGGTRILELAQLIENRYSQLDDRMVRAWLAETYDDEKYDLWHMAKTFVKLAKVLRETMNQISVVTEDRAVLVTYVGDTIISETPVNP